MRFPNGSGLLQQPCQIGSLLPAEEVATPGQQAAPTYSIGRNLVATHTAIALFDPPANGALSGIVGAIERFFFRAFPVPWKYAAGDPCAEAADSSPWLPHGTSSSSSLTNAMCFSRSRADERRCGFGGQTRSESEEKRDLKRTKEDFP